MGKLAQDIQKLLGPPGEAKNAITVMGNAEDNMDPKEKIAELEAQIEERDKAIVELKAELNELKENSEDKKGKAVVEELQQTIKDLEEKVTAADARADKAESELTIQRRLQKLGVPDLPDEKVQVIAAMSEEAFTLYAEAVAEVGDGKPSGSDTLDHGNKKGRSPVTL